MVFTFPNLFTSRYLEVFGEHINLPLKGMSVYIDFICNNGEHNTSLFSSIILILKTLDSYHLLLGFILIDRDDVFI